MLNLDCDLVQTPYGSYDLRTIKHADQTMALIEDEANPHAALYAAKTRGVTRIVEIVRAVARDRLLPQAAVIVPYDVIDLTVGRQATFFVNKGYGFLSQQQVFCPQLREAAATAQPVEGINLFTRGTLAVLDDPDAAYDPRWQAQIVARHGVPAAYLAKELELCYLPICVVGAAPDVLPLIERLLDRLPANRTCPCATAMQATRERGLVGDDWRTWV